MNFQALHKQRKFLLIAAAIGVIAVFLPWLTISVSMFGVSESNSINGFRSYGIMVFIAFIVAAIIPLMGKQEAALEKNLWFSELIAGAVAVLFLLISFFNLSNSVGGGFGIADASYGFGMWLAVAASVAILLISWMYRDPSNNLKEGFDSLKQTITTHTSTFNTPGSSAPKRTNTIDELERLAKLKENGSISEEEYLQMKAKIMTGDVSSFNN